MERSKATSPCGKGHTILAFFFSQHSHQRSRARIALRRLVASEMPREEMVDNADCASMAVVGAMLRSLWPEARQLPSAPTLSPTLFGIGFGRHSAHNPLFFCPPEAHGSPAHTMTQWSSVARLSEVVPNVALGEELGDTGAQGQQPAMTSRPHYDPGMLSFSRLASSLGHRSSQSPPRTPVI